MDRLKSITRVESARALDQTRLDSIVKKRDSTQALAHLGKRSLDRFFYCNVHMLSQTELKAEELSKRDQTYIKHHGCAETASVDVEEYAF